MRFTFAEGLRGRPDRGQAGDPERAASKPNQPGAGPAAQAPRLDIGGVFAAEDGLAAGALKYAKRRGLSVPNDLRIIGYNNSELSVCCHPELSSIDSRGDRLCQIIIDAMKLRLGGKETIERVYAKGYLVRRSTTDF